MTGSVPMRVLDRPPPRVEVERRPDGVMIVRSGYAFEPPAVLIVDLLGLAAVAHPERTFLAQRGHDRRWRRLTYAEAERGTAAVAAGLIARGLGPGAAAMILSENSLEHALLAFGALRAGLVVVPVSPAASLGGDLARLRYVLDLVEPALVFAQDGTRYAAALTAAAAPGRLLVTAAGPGLPLDALRATDPGQAVARRRAEIGPETPAKILFTSGSTGPPRGVVNTHANLIAALQMLRQVGEPPNPSRVHTLLDWLPWHHTFGGNVHLHGVLLAAGTLYIDDGRPLPDQFGATLANLREVSPTGFASVPATFPLLADALERDPALRAGFFANLRWMSYGGAVLPQDVWGRFQRLAVAETGARIPFGTGWGMTETGGVGTAVHWNVERTGLMGLPLPGTSFKLLPAGDRYEVRVKGPNVMAGYHRRPDLNAQAFDDEGYFRTGDAARWVDPAAPGQGLAFAGRLAEDFKLASGTWIQASTLRVALLDALQPLATDLVVVGPDRPWLGALVWLRADAGDGATPGAAVLGALRERLAAYNAGSQASSTRVRRLLIVRAPLSAAGGEVTDKRSINQRLVIERRAAEVAALYDEPPDPRRVVLDPAEQAAGGAVRYHAGMDAAPTALRALLAPPRERL